MCTGVLWVPGGEIASGIAAAHENTRRVMSDLCGLWDHVGAVFGGVARYCWEREGTRPKSSEGEKDLELHDERMAAGYQMR